MSENVRERCIAARERSARLRPPRAESAFISKRIMGADGQGTLATWSEDIHYGTVTGYNTVVFGQTFERITKPESELQGVICEMR